MPTDYDGLIVFVRPTNGIRRTAARAVALADDAPDSGRSKILATLSALTMFG